MQKKMNKYQKQILDKLIKQFDKQTDKSACVIKIKVSKIFKNYIDNQMEYDDFIELNESIEELENFEFITTIKEKYSERYEYIILNINKTEEIYSICKKTPIEKISNDTTKLLNKYLNKHKILDLYINDLIKDVKNNKLTGELKDLVKLEIILKGITGVLLNTKNIKYRELSQAIYGDSKTFENEASTIKRIITKYSNELVENNSSDDIFNEFNIYKNPTMIMIKGNAILKLSGSIIDLSKISGGIGITSDSIEDIEEIIVKGNDFYTIENKTSYFTFEKPNSVIMYLEGFHNSDKTKLLKKIYKNNSNIKYYHFGDIDAGGFYIYYNLKNKTEIPFKMYLMDKENLIKFKNFTKPLTEHDKKRLMSLKYTYNELNDIISYMLENNCKLEQEVISNSL